MYQMVHLVLMAKVISHELEIAAPIERVWDLTLDIERWPELTPTITSVERLEVGPLAVGSSARLVQPRQSPRVWTVTDLQAPTRFAWSARQVIQKTSATPTQMALSATLNAGNPISLPSARFT